ncbi:hypothetical protein FRC15_003321, partial [Serendipita sp. 397]
MDHAPWLDHSDQWDPSRVRLADVGGNGLTDLIYLGYSGIAVHFNEHGNSWTDPFVLSAFPVADNWASIQVADFLGNGTACLVWSTPISPNGRQMKYIDLMGGTKPNMLLSIANNLGVETRVHYSPSTKFYLDDKLAGRPWISRIPFPTQVIERVETFDRVGRTYHSCRYVYHHGYYDGREREMRGFGMVEAYDVEHFNIFDDANLSSTTTPDRTTFLPINIDPESSIPPVLTKTWYHTGLWRGESRISRYLEGEYWKEPGLTTQQLQSMQLADTNLPTSIVLRDGTSIPYLPHALEARESCRTLRGTAIRVEVYALDGTEKESLPYSVSETNLSINLLQPRSSINQNAVFMVLPREQLSFSYDRYTTTPSAGGSTYCSPRASHALALEVDRFGNVTRTASITYGQRHSESDPDNILTPADRARQATPMLTYQEMDMTNLIDTPDAYQLPLPSETRSYEILKVHADGNNPLITNLYTMSTIRSQIALLTDGAHDLPFEDYAGHGATEDHPYRRLIGRSRILYRKDDFTVPLPLGQIGSRALEYESYEQAFTPETLIAAYVDTGKVTSIAELERIMGEEAKYVHSNGDKNWWIPSGKLFYSPNLADGPAEELSYAIEHFFLPLRFRDPFYTENFNTEALVIYDQYDLLPVEMVDALQNRTSAGERDPDPTKPFVKSGVDYRLLMTSLIMDPNENVTAFAFDILGLVSGIALMGKPGQGIAVHANTPTIAYRDPLGGAFLTIAHNRFKYGDAAPGDPATEEHYTTRADIDIQGNRHQVFDSLERLVTRNSFGMLGQPVHYANMESGERWVLLDIEGKPKYTWDSRGYRFRAVFDQLQRTVETFQQLNTDTEMLVERAIFGETLASPENSNSRMALVQFDDQAGVSATDLYDFKGNPVTGKRVLAQDYKSTIDWLESVPLDNEEFKTTTSYDALNRAISIILPYGTIMRPKYNISGQIKQVEAMLAGEPGTTVFVSNIDYNARGQRTSITYRNGVSTTYEYDRLTNRLVHTITKRDPGAFPGDCPKPPLSGWPGCQIQNIFFTDDPMGNGTNIRDDAQQSIFFRNQRVDPTSSFIYDAIYRLIEA